MFAEWVTTGASWGIMFVSAVVTALLAIGLIIGLFALAVYIFKGDSDEEKDKKDRDSFGYPHGAA